MKEKSKKRCNLSITKRIIIYFTAFVMLVLCIIYLVEILLLGFFYRRTKIGELNDIADNIAGCLDSGNTEDEALESAIQYKSCILIFKVQKGELGECSVSVEQSADCAIHHLSDDELADYYRRADRNGGELLSSINDRNSRPKGNPGIADEKALTAIFVKCLSDKDGNEYVLFLNTEFSPIRTVVQTMKKQFIWLTLSILTASVLAAWFFAKRISGPLIRMNERAKRMAKGDYTPDFKPEGYKETVELAETLNYAAAEISKTDNLRKELISNVSHDLRTPLTMISGYAEVMRDIPGENTPENVQVIIDETKHLTALVNDMLDLSKIESGTMAPSRSVFSLTGCVNDVMQRYSALKEHEGYVITFEAQKETYVCADREMIVQVVYNLVNNAVNYTGSDRRVSVRQTEEINSAGVRNVRISVSDTGEGISSENIGNIWERYFREDKTHKRAVVGTGLGLSIVREILQKHNAAFGVESTEGRGTTFWFELPAVEK